MNLSDRDELLAVKINRVFAAARSLRGRNLPGYSNSCEKLDALRNQLETGDADRMKRILNRVDELSGGTFYWDP